MRQGNDGFRGLAGMVGVGIDGLLDKFERLDASGGGECEVFPLEGGRELKGQPVKRRGAGVAHSEAGVDSQMGTRRGDVDIEIVGGEGEGVALGIGNFDRFFRHGRRVICRLWSVRSPGCD